MEAGKGGGLISVYPDEILKIFGTGTEALPSDSPTNDVLSRGSKGN